MSLRSLAFVAFSFLAACSSPTPSGGPSPEGPPAEGDVAPRFELPASDGTRMSLEQLMGKPVLLYFSMGPG